MSKDIFPLNSVPEARSVRMYLSLFYGWYQTPLLGTSGSAWCFSSASSRPSQSNSLSSSSGLADLNVRFGTDMFLPSAHVYLLCSQSHLRLAPLFRVSSSKPYSIWSGIYFSPVANFVFDAGSGPYQQTRKAGRQRSLGRNR